MITTMTFDMLLLISVVACSDMFHAAMGQTAPLTYVINFEQTTWKDGSDECERQGGTLGKLVDISTVPDILLSLNATADLSGMVWVGLSRNMTGTWTWPDGSEPTWINWGLLPVSTSAKCAAVSLTSPHLWSPAPCDTPLPSMCQFQRGSCRFLEFADKRISVHNIMLLYDQTPATCKDVCPTLEGGCHSFEYHAHEGQCQFNTGNMWSLNDYFYHHPGWTYYHWTCTSGEVIGSPASSSSTTTLSTSHPPSMSTTIETSTIQPSSTLLASVETSVPSETLPTSSPTLSTTLPMSSATDLLQLSETLVTSSPVFERTSSMSASSSALLEDAELVTDCIVITKTFTLFETSQRSVLPHSQLQPEVTSLTEIVTASSVVPVEESETIEKKLIERKQQLRRTSADDKRTSSRYIGYIAVTFVSCIFGSVVMFDIISLCRHWSRKGKFSRCCKWADVLRINNKNSKSIAASRKKSSIPNALQQANISSNIFDNDHHSTFRSDGQRLWRLRQWSHEDSGISDGAFERENETTFTESHFTEPEVDYSISSVSASNGEGNSRLPD